MSSSRSRGQRTRGSVRPRQPRSPPAVTQGSNPGGRPFSPGPCAGLWGWARGRSSVVPSVLSVQGTQLKVPVLLPSSCSRQSWLCASVSLTC